MAITTDEQLGLFVRMRQSLDYVNDYIVTCCGRRFVEANDACALCTSLNEIGEILRGTMTYNVDEGDLLPVDESSPNTISEGAD